MRKRNIALLKENMFQWGKLATVACLYRSILFHLGMCSLNCFNLKAYTNASIDLRSRRVLLLALARITHYFLDILKEKQKSWFG